MREAAPSPRRQRPQVLNLGPVFGIVPGTQIGDPLIDVAAPLSHVALNVEVAHQHADALPCSRCRCHRELDLRLLADLVARHYSRAQVLRSAMLSSARQGQFDNEGVRRCRPHHTRQPQQSPSLSALGCGRSLAEATALANRAAQVRDGCGSGIARPGGDPPPMRPWPSTAGVGRPPVMPGAACHHEPYAPPTGSIAPKRA